MNGHWFLLSMLVIYLVMILARYVEVCREEKKEREEEERWKACR